MVKLRLSIITADGRTGGIWPINVSALGADIWQTGPMTPFGWPEYGSYLFSQGGIMPHMKRATVRLPEYEQTISLQRLARKWQMPRRQVRRLVQNGKLPFIEIAGQIRVPISESKRPCN